MATIWAALNLIDSTPSPQHAAPVRFISIPKGGKVNQGEGNITFYLGDNIWIKPLEYALVSMHQACDLPTVFVFTISHVKIRQHVKNNYWVYAVKKGLVIWAKQCHLYADHWGEFKSLWTEVCDNQSMNKVFSLLGLLSKIGSQTSRWIKLCKYDTTTAQVVFYRPTWSANFITFNLLVFPFIVHMEWVLSKALSQWQWA